MGKAWANYRAYTLRTPVSFRDRWEIPCSLSFNHSLKCEWIESIMIGSHRLSWRTLSGSKGSRTFIRRWTYKSGQRRKAVSTLHSSTSCIHGSLRRACTDLIFSISGWWSSRINMNFHIAYFGLGNSSLRRYFNFKPPVTSLLNKTIISTAIVVNGFIGYLFKTHIIYTLY